jgi:hypothetical protein
MEVTMTSATNQRASGAGGRHAESRGYGLILFASVLLLVVGFFSLIYGIAAIAIAMDVVALYGLCAYASRPNLEAV